MIRAVEALLRRFAAARGAEVLEFQQQDVEPSGDGFIIGVRALVASGGTTEWAHIYVNTASNAAADDRSLRLADESGRLAVVWEYPADPALPALTAMSFPEAAGQTLAKFGVEAPGAALTVEAYRPGKRAVFRIDAGERRFFAKVVRPIAAAAIDELHRSFLDAGVPVPAPLGYSDSGLLLLERLPGISAAARIRTVAGSAGFLASLDALSHQIARVPLSVPARPSLASRVEWYGARIREQAPAFAGDADALIPLIRHRYERAAAEPTVTIHGDMHLGQIFVDPDDPTTITGVLDIDTAGLGEPADDRGALYGHVRVSAAESHAAGDSASADAFTQLAGAIAAGFRDGRVRAIAATHLMGHALAAGSRGTQRGGAVASWLMAEARTLLA